MKTQLKLGILIIMIVFTSCKGCIEKIITNTSKYAKGGKSDANQIIEYNNALVELTDKNSDYLKSLERSLESIQKGLVNPTNNYAFVGLMPPIDIVNWNRYNVKPEDPPQALKKEDRDFFKENVKALNTTLDSIKAISKDLFLYIKAEDFKDDNGAKGKKLLDSIYVLDNKYYDHNAKVLAKLETIADEAERITLKSSPLKDYIFAMKDDRKEAHAFYDFLSKNAKEYKKVEPKAKELYNAMERNQKKHAAMEAPNMKKFPGKENALKAFYDAYNEYLISARKLMRDAAPYGAIAEWQLEDLYRQEEYMRNRYNNFVQ